MKKTSISLSVFFLFLIINTQGAFSQAGGAHLWSAEEKEAVIDECLAGLSNMGINDKKLGDEYCECLLQKAEDNFTSMDEMNATPAETIRLLIQPCVDQLAEQLKSKQSEPEPEWSKADQDMYLNECRANASRSVQDKDIVEKYCICTLRTFEKAHPDSKTMENISEEEIMELIQPCLEDLKKK